MALRLLSSDTCQAPLAIDSSCDEDERFSHERDPERAERAVVIHNLGNQHLALE